MLQQIKTAHMAAIAAAQKNAKLYSELHPHDFGSCGGCAVLISFGRKRKIKQQFLDAGLFTENDDFSVYGKKSFSIRVNDWQVKGYNQQNASYKEHAMREYITTMQNLLPALKLDLFLHTWCD